uniref:(northern house mosquito) hypothetical protein n=1 Tax=Culex pipiens TaxID=7175 RepID=A0A8D8DP97_CULPI
MGITYSASIRESRTHNTTKSPILMQHFDLSFFARCSGHFFLIFRPSAPINHLLLWSSHFCASDVSLDNPRRNVVNNKHSCCAETALAEVSDHHSTIRKPDA